MLFWLFVILLAVGILLGILSYNGCDIFKEDKHPKLHRLFWKHDEAIGWVSMIMIVLFGLSFLLAVGFLCPAYFGINAKVQQLREQRKALEFKVESKSYRDEFGLLNKEVIDEIQAWNEDIAYKKALQRDFWLGIFYPNVYDEFETIDYERY